LMQKRIPLHLSPSVLIIIDFALAFLVILDSEKKQKHSY
jgi:hypothetical protein